MVAGGLGSQVGVAICGAVGGVRRRPRGSVTGPNGILDLGFEAGENDFKSGPILNDLLHLVEVDIEADIHISTLLALYEIARQEGAGHRSRSEET